MTSSTSPRRGRPASAAAATTCAGTWTVYILRCADDTLYTGCTTDLERRLRAHGAGRVKYTRGRLPVVPLYTERVCDRSAALRREAAIKRMSRQAKLALPAGAKL